MRFIIHYFKIFYKYVGVKLILFAFLVCVATLIDGLGLSLVMPLLELGNDITPKSKYSEFIYGCFRYLNIEVSLISLVVFILLIFIFKALFKFTHEAIGAHILYKLQRKLRIDIVEMYKKMKYSFFVNTEIGYFNNIITTEIQTTIAAFGKYIIMMARTATLIVYLFYAFLFSWQVSLMTILTGGIIYFLFFPLTLKVRKISKILVKSHGSLQNAFIQFILNFKYLKATSNFENPSKSLRHEIEKQQKEGFKLTLLEKITPTSLELVAMMLFSIAVIYLTAIQGQNIASIMVTMLFLYRMMLRLPEFQTSFQGFMAQTGAVDAVEEAKSILAKNLEIDKGKDIKGFSSQLTLQNLHFSFGNTQILSNINMKIPRNHTIGVVGESGSGKSTLLDIITGLMNPQSGKVMIDGMDYKDLSKVSLRRLFGYITQEPVVFNDTIFNNVTLWSGKDDDSQCMDRVEKACQIAHCLDFIHRTEKGYSTIVGDRGIKLSGGQCQRLGIARELFRDPEIIIFDEATSSLDSKSENLIQKSVNDLMGQKTMIIIAHRLSTVKKCDYIYVIDNGRILQEGTWDNLIIDSNSLFLKMCQLQGIKN